MGRARLKWVRLDMVYRCIFFFLRKKVKYIMGILKKKEVKYMMGIFIYKKKGKGGHLETLP
jgi:hypothetical protein